MLEAYTPYFRTAHVVFVIAWMAGLLYLPRLFIYHLEFDVGTKPYEVFCRMEQRLLKIIMRPAILLTFLSGGLLAFAIKAWASPWFYLKLFFVFLLAGCHGYFSRLSRGYQEGRLPSLSKKALIVLNEIPFLLAIGIVCVVFLKPR